MVDAHAYNDKSERPHPPLSLGVVAAPAIAKFRDAARSKPRLLQAIAERKARTPASYASASLSTLLPSGLSIYDLPGDDPSMPKAR